MDTECLHPPCPLSEQHQGRTMSGLKVSAASKIAVSAVPRCKPREAWHSLRIPTLGPVSWTDGTEKFKTMLKTGTLP